MPKLKKLSRTSATQNETFICKKFYHSRNQFTVRQNHDAELDRYAIRVLCNKNYQRKQMELNMKHLIFLIILTLVSHAWANSPIKVCERSSDPQVRQECVQRVNQSSYFDLKAVEMCEKLYFENAALVCLYKIADKKYTDKEIQMCRQMPTDTSTVECLTTTGI